MNRPDVRWLPWPQPLFPPSPGPARSVAASQESPSASRLQAESWLSVRTVLGRDCRLCPEDMEGSERELRVGPSLPQSCPSEAPGQPH